MGLSMAIRALRGAHPIERNPCGHSSVNAIRVAIRVAISGDLEELLSHQILGLTNPFLWA